MVRVWQTGKCAGQNLLPSENQICTAKCMKHGMCAIIDFMCPFPLHIKKIRAIGIGGENGITGNRICETYARREKMMVIACFCGQRAWRLHSRAAGEAGLDGGEYIGG